MKKLIVMLFLTLNTVCFGSLEYTNILDADLISVQEKENGSTVTFQDYTNVFEFGSPALPVKSIRFIIDPGFIPTHLEINNSEPVIFGKTLEINPDEYQGIIDNSGPVQQAKDVSIYNENADYPGVLAEITGTGYLMGAKVVDILIHPIQYNPVTGQMLIYEEISLTVEGSYTGSEEDQTRYASKKKIKKTTDYLISVIDNPGDFETCFIPPIEINYNKKARTEISRDGISDENNQMEPLEYLIITSEALEASFEDLEDEKDSKGIPADIITIEDIVVDYPAGDKSESIRACIEHLYRNGDLQWVLLGGDVEIIPSRVLIGRKNERYVSTDMYYSCLDGDWNSNKNAYIGDQVWSWDDSDNMDLYPEVWIGRAPVRTVEEADDFVVKMQIYYWQDINNTEYQNDVLFLETDMFNAGDAENAGEYLEEILDDLGLDVTHINATTSEHFTPQDALDEIENGYSIVFNLSHGNEYKLQCGDGDGYEGPITRADFMGLDCDLKYGMMICIACEPGMFNSDCIGEAWIRSIQGGGIGFIGSSTYDIPMVSINSFIKPFEDMIANGESYCMGEILAKSKIANISMSQRYGAFRTVFMGYNLLGDPEAYIWIQEPNEFEADPFNETYIAGEDNNADLNIVDDITAADVPFASVGMSVEDDFYYTTFSDEEGDLEIGSFFPDSVASGTFTVMAPNYLPYTTTLSITSGTNDPTITGYVLADDVNNIDNDLVDAGEKFSLDINVYNSTVSSQSITSGVLSCTDTCVTVSTTANSSSFPMISSEQTVTNSTPYVFTISPFAPDSHVVTLDLEFTYSTNVWYDSFDLLIHAPDIEVLYTIYDDDGTSDQDNDHDHLYDEDETFYLDVALINTGSGATSEMTGTLTSTETCVSDITGTYTFAATDGSSELHGFGQVEVALNSTEVVANIEFKLNLENPEDAPGRDHNDIAIAEQFDAVQPATFADLTTQQFGREGIELLCDPATNEDLEGYIVYRDPDADEEAGFGPLNNGNLITGGSRYVDYLVDPGETYDYKIKKVVDGKEIRHSETTTAWFSHPLRDDFPVDIGFGYPAGAAITDFDEDGDCEFWIGTNQGEIVQVNEDGTKTTIDLADIDHPNAPANLDKVNLLTKPVLGDVDGDPRLELVFGANCSDYDTYLLVFEWARADNELVFDCAIELHDQDSLNVVTYGGMPSLCDINEDGQPEISIIMFNVNFTTKNTTVHLKEYALVGNDYVWRDYPGWNVFDPSVYTTCTPAFGDIGGNPHVFYCNGPGDEPETNHFVWDIDSKIFGLELDAKVGSVVLGDIDNANSDLEVVFIDKELGLYARDAASVSPHVGAAWPANTNENTEAHGISLYKTISPFDPIANQPVLADINGDNDLEIIVSSPDSMYVYNNDGTRLANWPQPRNNLINENWCGSALVADVDDDNDLDIIMPNGHHQIEAWDGTSGDLLSYWPIVVGDRIIDYSIKDIDDDDDLELIVTTGAGYLYIYELGTGDGDVVWGQRCHDDWHTSNYEFVVPAEPANEPVYGHWYDTDHFYVIEGDCHVPDGEDWILEDGVVVYMHANVDIEIESGADMKAIGTAQNQITFTNDGQNLFNHIKFAATSGSVNSELEYCIFEGGYDGLYVTGLAPTTGALEIDNCTFSDCNYGIYINSSKVNISNSTIEDNAYNGIYLTSCSAGKVVIDGNTIQNNGTYGSIYDAGVSLSTNSDPEIINTEITGNTGGGIYCVSSAPDLDTYTSSTGTAPNTIHENGIGYGSGDQDDEDGAEIYLSLTSYPTIGSNNIWDAYYDMGYINFGAFIYKSTSLVEYDIVNAKGNYWGPVTVGESDFRWTVTAPPKTFAEMFNISSDSSELIDDVTSVEIAMGYWSDGEYEDADEYFRLAVDDEQSEAINAIHYLTGTTLKLEGDLDDLRTFYLGIVNNNEDDEVVKVAQRFATNCLSESGEYEDAAEEYDLARQNAETLNDSILAVIDYIAVSELVDSDINVAEAVIVPQKITSLLKLLDESGGSSSGSIIPDDYVLSAAFPNPFNSVTKIKFGLPEMSIVKVSVYDASGRLVKILANGVHLAGYHTTLLNGNTLSSGIYFYRIDAGSFKQTRKLILLR